MPNANKWSSFSAVPLACLLILSGCAVGPNYIAPEIQTSDSFKSISDGLSTDPISTQWWKSFEDPILQSLIDRSVSGNKDIKIAEAHLEQSRQLLSEARFDLFPTIRSNGAYQKSQTSIATGNRGLSSVSGNAITGNNTSTTSFDRIQENYQLGFDATWELDVFGRVRRANEQREALLQSTEASLRDVVVSLVAEVGSTYFQLRGNQNRLSVARRNADNQRETVKLTQARLDGGQATELDTSRARAQLNNTLASIPPLEASIKTGIFRIAVLLGEQPHALDDELTPEKALPNLPSLVSIGDPKTLLQRRPDIRAAERNLAAATAGVGVATADLYPRITFTGNIGYSARTPNDFSSNAETWSFGPGISWAAFDLGRIRAILKASEADKDAILGQFESTVLLALEETEGSFIRFNAARDSRDFLSEAAKASSKAAELANLRYRDGVTDFITVLDAQRTMLSDQDLLAQSETNTATSLIAVFKALGGGWESYVDTSVVQQDVESVWP